VRALLVAHRLAWPAATGIGRYVRELTTALAAAPGGWDLALGAAPEDEAADWVPAGVERHRLGRSRRRTHLGWTAVHRPPVERLAAPADVVHVLNGFAPVPSRAPQVWTIHDVFPVNAPQWSGRVDGWAARRALAWVRDGDALVITPSQAAADAARDLAGLDPARLRVVHEGVAEPFRTPPGTEARRRTQRAYGVADGEYLLAVGGLGDRKNLGVVADALHRVRPSGEGPELLVVGPDRQGAEGVRAALDALGGRVRVAGYAPDADLPGLVAGARAVLHPSREEGFGLVPVEAMAAGAPVLAGTAASVVEVAGSAACLLDPDDADAWAGAIERVRHDDAWRAELVAAGTDRARRFTWDRAAAETLAVYSEVVR
jgi:glycosyltransferase involved in cell wall biosynthesis